MPVPRKRPSSPRSLRARVRRFVRDHRLVAQGERVLVGVSGGADSTCLLLTLAALRRSLEIDLHAAYFDHQLRGARAAERELRYLHGLTDKLAVPLHAGGGDVREHVRAKRRSLEEAARELRYRFLKKIARKVGCDSVAVGHTRDDQAETVLLHLLRGSGLRGLAAMAPSAAWPLASKDGLRLVRPLLVASRADTEACCRDAGLEALEDPSNNSRAHLRNRVRAELLPLLREYNPRIDDALVRLADAASDDIAALESLAADALAIEPDAAGAVHLDRRTLGALPVALQRHAVRLATTHVLGDARGLSDRHVRALLRANDGPTGTHLDLARGLRTDVTRSAVVLTRRPSAPAVLPAGEVPLPVPGHAVFGPWRIETKMLRGLPRDLTSGDGRVAYLDASVASQGLSLRKRKRGDRFHPLGVLGTKKLQDFFVDAHVPRTERDTIPLVCNERGIAWVVTQRPAEWARVHEGTRRTIRLQATRTP